MAEADRAAFERFVAEHGDRLLHTAYGLCGDWQHAEDLVQQALTTVARRWGAIGSHPLGYAYRCLVRSNIDRWRVRNRRPEMLLDPDDLAAAGPLVSDACDDGAVLAALTALPPRQRAIVVLRYVQDLSEADTADLLDISVGAVKSGASRALARLRQTALEESNHE
ncbi:MAG: RNA polymerase sigma factor [Jatrophihabitans sp.]|uniref:RNA polymerase sigma factor n=1 Tax=Jatrophihabitans sp. TaxID=1932789 RepID=UPI003914F8EB